MNLQQLPWFTVPHGQTLGREDNGTDFAGVQVGSSVTNEFVLYNEGVDPIILSGSPQITILGAHADDFTVEFPSPPLNGVVNPGDRITFSITFTPSDLGDRNASVVM